MRVCIHRGSKQIGGSCVEVESLGQRLLIDLGLPLDAEENSVQYLPKIAGLDGSDPSLLGILISHPHLDHFGLLKHISPKIVVGMGSAARRILTAAAPFMPFNVSVPAQGWTFESEQSFEVGTFQITPFLVDHAAYDAYALLIESEGKRLFYSGDLRVHGRKAVLVERLISNPPKNIDVLLLEGSSLGRLKDNQQYPTEAEIEEQLVQAFSTSNGLALVHASAQNIDRIVSIFRACKRTGRKLIIDLYTAAILEATGNPNIPQSNWSDVGLFIPQTQRIQIKENAWFNLLKHHSVNRIFPENLHEIQSKSVLLFRPLHCRDLERSNCLKGAAYIYSQWEGYWEQDSYNKLKEWLERNALQKISIHTSGHASIKDLKRIVEALNPKTVVPIHTFYPEQYGELFPKVQLHGDCEWWEIARENRAISKDFMNNLLKPEGTLSPLLERVKKDHTLMLAIRDCYINIYYRGGNILRVTEHPEGFYIPFFDEKYNELDKKIPDSPATIISQEDVQIWVESFAERKNIMDEYFSAHGKAEREFQQLVARENNCSSISNETEYFIADIEATDALGRFDMMAIRWLAKDRKNGSKCAAALIEMKYGDNALDNDAGILKHLKDMDAFISDKERYAQALRTMESQFNQLDELGLLKFNKGVSNAKVKLDPCKKPEVIFILANHNPRSPKLQKILSDPEIEKYQNSENFSLKFFIATFAGYGLHAVCMHNLAEFRNWCDISKKRK